MEFFLSLTIFTNNEVRLFEEFDSFRRKWESRITGIHCCVLIMIYSRTCFSTRPNLKMSGPYVVCNGGRQGSIDLFGLVKFILSVSGSCCIWLYNCTRSSNNGRIGLDFCFICDHKVMIDIVWILIWLLKAHWVVWAFVFLLYT